MKIKYRISKDKRCKEINDFIQKEFPHLLKERKPDLILVSGGDGAILHAIQEYNHHKVPFLGYGTGTLNFLMNDMNLEQIKKFIQKLEKDEIKLKNIETTKISVSLQKMRNGKKIKIGQAVNEVVLGSKLMGYHSFSINSNDGSFNDFEIKGSGICISTDLGSTGYNFNLGGAVLPLGSNLWSLLGIVCNRYLEDILNTDNIVIENISKRPGLSIFLDSIKQNVLISYGDKIIIQKGDVVKLAFYDQKEFFKKRIDISSRYRKG
ncbi:MAG TPA: NAD(+)/NADH kinase [bacterium]|nr:NAD(+)/NADH kinase [bacterium]